MIRLMLMAPMLSLWGILGCVGDGPAPGIPGLRLVGPPLLLHEIEVPEPISSELDGMGFAKASAVEVVGGRLVVLEAANDRLVVFDERYRPVRFIGRQGAGPGELRGAVDVAAWENEYAVVELNNARVSVFDTSGAFLRSFGVPHGFSNIGYGPDGTIYVNAYDQANYLLAARRMGALRPFGVRPADLYPAGTLTGPASGLSGYFHFAVTADGNVHVYDGVLGAVVTFNPLGERIDLRRLPPSIAQELIREAALVARDFGGNGRGAPASITHLSLTDDERLLLLFHTSEAIGLLVDPRTHEAREIRRGPGVDPELAGYGGVVRRGIFYRLTMDDLRLFRLTPE